MSTSDMKPKYGSICLQNELEKQRAAGIAGIIKPMNAINKQLSLPKIKTKKK